MSRPALIPRTAALLALCALTACDGEGLAPVDAGADAAEALCVGAEAEPLQQCTPPAAPDTACALSVHIGEQPRAAATFDRAGRLTSSSEYGFGEIYVFDAAGQRTRWERVLDGCLISRTLYWRDGDRAVRRSDEPERAAKCTTEVLAGEVAVERLEDEGCDCAGIRVAEQCDVEGGRAVRCQSFDRDGASAGIETWAWTADGLLAREADDFDSDGVDDHVELFDYDAQGRVTLHVEKQGACDGEMPCTVRRTWTYEDDARRTTRRTDQGDDGSIERIDRTTVDALGRRVLDEISNDGGETWTVTAWTREVDGDRVTITRSVDGVAREVVVEDTDPAGRLLRRAQRLLDRDLTTTLELVYDDAGRIAQERITSRGEGIDYACAADYAWVGDPCPALRAWTDADPAPREPVSGVGGFCTRQGEGP